MDHRRSTTAIALGLMLIIAGCGGSASSSAPTSSTVQPESSTVPATPTSTPTPTSTATPPPLYHNPWNKETIHVAIENPTDRNYQPIVRQALRYWETDGQKWADWVDLRFSIISDSKTANADAIIRFGSVSTCATGDEGVVGCAPYPPGGSFEQTPTAKISTNYTNESTKSVVKHEVGHLLGVEHKQTPKFMQAESELVGLPQMDAVDRPNPWGQDTLRIYIDDSAVPVPLEETVMTQVDHAISYYNDGGEGATPGGVELVLTERQADADVVIEAVRNSDIENRAYASVQYYGTDPDDDRALEQVENGTIRVAYNVAGETGYMGYYTGEYLGLLLTLESDPAPPWEDDDITYRDEWWERPE